MNTRKIEPRSPPLPRVFTCTIYIYTDVGPEYVPSVELGTSGAYPLTASAYLSIRPLEGCILLSAPHRPDAAMQTLKKLRQYSLRKLETATQGEEGISFSHWLINISLVENYLDLQRQETGWTSQFF